MLAAATGANIIAMNPDSGCVTLPAFIRDTELLVLDNYPGRIARCRFFLADYRDENFLEAGIGLPDHLAHAVPKRRAEYLAGRCLARDLLTPLGYTDYRLLPGKDRAPQWPAGIAGALSHNVDTALCAVHLESGLGGVGLDVETLMAVEQAEDLWGAIVGVAEYDALRRLPLGFDRLLTLTFSAKESLFKALYPQVRCYFDFLDVRLVAIDAPQRTFQLELLRTLTPQCHAGRRFSGCYWYGSDDVTTFLYC